MAEISSLCEGLWEGKERIVYKSTELSIIPSLLLDSQSCQLCGGCDKES